MAKGKSKTPLALTDSIGFLGGSVKEQRKHRHNLQYLCHANACINIYIFKKMHAFNMKDLDLCKFLFLRSPKLFGSSSTRQKVNLNIYSASAFAWWDLLTDGVEAPQGGASMRGKDERKEETAECFPDQAEEAEDEHHPGSGTLASCQSHSGGSERTSFFPGRCAIDLFIPASSVLSPWLPRTPSLLKHSLPSFKYPTPIPIHTVHFAHSGCLELTAP